VKALLLESIHPSATEVFHAAGIEVETRPGALSEEELVATLPGFELLGIRSGTNLTERVFREAPDLLAVGAFCIGTNQIDLQTATERGVAVFNAPFSNTRSVVELAVAEIIAMTRRLTVQDDAMHAGKWQKSAAGSHEVRGRRLGIIGYGNIGSQLSVLAEAMGLRVIFYDTADVLAHGNAERVATMDELLARADVVSLHVDGRPGNAGLFGDAEFRRMKPRSMLINASRGMVVDNAALREHILSGHLAGAALDVFPIEPKRQGEAFESPLRGLDNGGFVSRKLVSFLQRGDTSLSVNLPELSVPPLDGHFRIAHLHRNVPGVVAEIDRVLSEEGANVTTQYLSTLGEQGYVITDVADALTDKVVDQLAGLPETIWLRTHV
jgi:D-3-phosphoglycerate dehydrogenase